MNIDTIKIKYPSLYNDIIELGVAKERDRVGSWLVYQEADINAAIKGIKEGSIVSPAAMIQLSEKVVALKSGETPELRAFKEELKILRKVRV